jgi:4-aminobutyrate aminotransferase-like enzyme/Ser/Thr protein kinase RdoA (MazF antagonist)
MSNHPATHIIEPLVRQHWGLQIAGITPLPGEVDANYALQTEAGQRYGLKLHLGVINPEIDLQIALLQHIAPMAADLASPNLLQTLVPTSDGRALVALALPDGRIYQARLCTWLEGEVWARVEQVPMLAVTDLGHALAELDLSLRDFKHPAAWRAHRWDSARFDELADCIELVEQPEKQQALRQLQQRFREQIAPRLQACPQQVIHSDANDYNLLLDRAGRLSGVLDFGDAIYTRRLFEVANACAYVIDRMPDPVEVIAELTAAYHERNPLQDNEIELIFDAVQLRLGMSMSLAARQIRQWPDNQYLLISQTAVWRNWQRLLAENPAMVLARIRARCALAPSPNAERAERWLRRHAASAKPIFAIDWSVQKIQRLDWRANHNPNPGQAAAQAEQLMRQSLARLDGRIGIGAFGEDRAVYIGDNYATAIEGERRNRHIGLDVFLPAGTPLHAPFDAVVECCGIDPGGFGGLLILRHQAEPNADPNASPESADGTTPFWTLYGHLNPASLPWQAGQSVAAGALLGELGDESVNGGWAPHLHLQVMGDLLGIPGLDWPGACSARQWPVFERVCFQPNLLLGFNLECQDHHQRTASSLQRERRQRMGPSLSLNYRQPLHIVRGEGCYLFDAQGQRWLDMVNNVAHVGHCNPRVLQAAMHQQTRLNTNTRYLHEHILDYARRLCLTMPPELSCVFMVNSGSEANDLALRLARAYTGSREVICVDHAYHGNLTSVVDVSPYKFNGKGGSGQPAHTHIAQAPDLYRGPWRYADQVAGVDVGANYARSVAEICQRLQAQQRKPGLFLVEAIQGCAGQLPLPPGYLQALYPIVRAAGGLVQSDEVQVGFGRVGSHMWAFETQGVVPDIVTMGKPIGNGHPMAAVVTRPEIAAAFANGMEYFNTFGGNPVSCAIGLAVLDEIEEQHLMQRAARIGNRLMAGMRSLAERFEMMGDVRGIGMYIGMELVKERHSQAPAPGEMAQLIELMKQKQVLLSSEGPFNNVLKIKPPLVFGETECDYFLTALEQSLGQLA